MKTNRQKIKISKSFNKKKKKNHRNSSKRMEKNSQDICLTATHKHT